MKFIVLGLTVVLCLGLIEAQFGRNYYGFPSFPSANRQRLPSTFAVVQPSQPQQQVFPEWFRSEVDDPEDCQIVPDEVNTGPIEDLCNGAEVGTRFCVCVKRGNSLGNSLYYPMCGECKDPCALKFEYDRYPRKKRRNDDNDDDDDNENENLENQELN